MSKPTVAQLAEQIAGLADVVGKLVEAQAQPSAGRIDDELKLIESEATDLTELRSVNGDEFKDFEKVFTAQLSKAQSWSKTNGPSALWYVWSPTKRRSYVFFGKKTFKNGTKIGTVSAAGKFKPLISGLPLD